MRSKKTQLEYDIVLDGDGGEYLTAFLYEVK